MRLIYISFQSLVDLNTLSQSTQSSNFDTSSNHHQMVSQSFKYIFAYLFLCIILTIFLP